MAIAGQHQGEGQQWAQPDAQSVAAKPHTACGGPRQDCCGVQYTHLQPPGCSFWPAPQNGRAAVAIEPCASGEVDCVQQHSLLTPWRGENWPVFPLKGFTARK